MNVKLTLTQMTATFSREMMIGMLRRGQIGEQILQILEVIATSQEVAEETEAVSA